MPLNPYLICAVIPREGVESGMSPATVKMYYDVIPREGVESFCVAFNLNRLEILLVIPREGVERSLRNRGGRSRFAVIPREGVESRRRAPKPPSGMR